MILPAHNPLEEGDGGLYELFEGVAGSDPEMLQTLGSAPEVPVLPHNERPGVLEATRRAVGLYSISYSSSVDRSPSSIPIARAFNTRRIIFPLRVFGSDATKLIFSGFAIGPTSCPM